MHSLPLSSLRQGGEEGTVFGRDAWGVLSTAGDCNLFASALSKAGLSEELASRPGPHVIFAPSDDAFVALAQKLGVTKLGLLSLPNLAEIIRGHVASPCLPGHGPSGGDIDATSLTGRPLTFKAGLVNGGLAKVGRSKPCTNGVVHIIDAVLLSP